MKSKNLRQEPGRRILFEMKVPTSRLQEMIRIFNVWGGVDCEIIQDTPKEPISERPDNVNLRVRVSVSALNVFLRFCEREQTNPQQVVNA